ncbi:hypothetical protein BJ944DRAFT_244101 [Cunninghamella echinulata]|nr:hypothetical protein BJ944DRAFT_244101 [Cunninghamella echinulata]
MKLSMKSINIFVLALWLASMVAFAATLPEETNGNGGATVAQPLDAHRWNRCWWTDCTSRHPSCPDFAYKKKTHHCNDKLNSPE